jgi:hypothetical protein
MYTWIMAGIAGILTVVAILKIPFGKAGDQNFCSYLSVTLPLLGLVVLQERPRSRSLVETVEQEHKTLPQPVDEEGAAVLLRRIEAESSPPQPLAPHTLPPQLSPLEFLSSIVVAPRRAFRELSRRACSELVATTLVILLLQPVVNGNPQASFLTNLVFLSVFFLLYASGRACLLLLACRWFSCRLSLRTAFQGVLVNEVVFAFLLGALLMVSSLQGMSGQIPYIRLGLGEWLLPLGQTNPVLFNYLAQLHAFTIWGFSLWWLGLATLAGVGLQKSFVAALLSFVAMYVYVCPLRHLVQALVVW